MVLKGGREFGDIDNRKSRPRQFDLVVYSKWYQKCINEGPEIALGSLDHQVPSS
jgi:hypothetical protein